MKIQLAIFDLDGVLTSTTHQHFEAWALLFKQHFGSRIQPEWECDTKGVSRIDSLMILLKRSGIVVEDAHMIETLANEKNSIYQRLIYDFDASKLLPGAKDIIRFLKDMNVKIALGSASKSGPQLLHKLGIIDQFDYIVNPEAKKSKPHPDIFLDAMHHFNLEPSMCLAFEDAQAGIEAIKRAGMFAIGVGDEVLEDADWKVQDLTEIDTKTLQKLIEDRYESK